MVTLTTKRGKEVQLKTIGEWYDLFAGDGRLGGLVAFEQACLQSARYKVCIECLTIENLILCDKRALIKSTDYYLCQECLDYYNSK